MKLREVEIFVFGVALSHYELCTRQCEHTARIQTIFSNYSKFSVLSIDAQLLIAAWTSPSIALASPSTTLITSVHLIQCRL